MISPNIDKQLPIARIAEIYTLVLYFPYELKVMAIDFNPLSQQDIMATHVLKYHHYGTIFQKSLYTPGILEMIPTQTDMCKLLTSARVS